MLVALLEGGGKARGYKVMALTYADVMVLPLKVRRRPAVMARCGVQ